MRLITVILFTILAPFAKGVTINSASCSMADVQAAVNSAKDGDTVIIPNPAGEYCPWDGTVNIDASRRNIIIRGQSRDTTHIQCNAKCFSVSGAENYQWVLSDLKISELPGQRIWDGAIGISGTGKNWKVHDLNYESSGRFGYFIRTTGYTYGVIYNIHATGTIVELLNAKYDNWNSWTRHYDWGDEKAIFVEDCTINWGSGYEGAPVIDGDEGARVVFRHNTVRNTIAGGHGFDSGDGSSMFSAEVYSNNFTIDGTSAGTWAWFAHWRGGSILLHNNRFIVADDIWVTPSLNLKTYRAEGGNSYWPPCNGAQYKWGTQLNQDWSGATTVSTEGKWMMCSDNRMRLCTADSDCGAEGQCTEYVDGTSGSGIYPCFQQPGRGTNNSLSPCYQWDNRWSGGVAGSRCATECEVKFAGGVGIQENRDYYNARLPGYAPYPYPHPLRECMPSCSGRECGPDGCGGTCGTCEEGYNCQSGQCEAACIPNWECSEWGPCTGGEQARTCTDTACGGSRTETCSCSGADTDCDGCISQAELMAYIRQWKTGNATLTQLMEAISLWKKGC